MYNNSNFMEISKQTNDKENKLFDENEMDLIK